MILCFLFIFFIFESSIKSQSTTTGTYWSTKTETTQASTTREKQPGFQLIASPDYPVLAGQSVHLQCKSLNVSTYSLDWSWQLLKGQTWKEVNSDGELILTQPEQSGVYRCQDKSGFTWSQNHTVSIVAIKASTSTTRENQPGVQLIASPDYPVLAGQSVHLQCKSLIVSTYSVDWSWQFLKGQTWKEVNSDGELILTQPEQSGVYRCQDKSGFTWSQNHTVSIVAIKASMEENLGFAAFIFSLVILIIIIAGLLLVVCKRIRRPKTPSSPAVKVNDPGPKDVPKRGYPMDESDGDLYINYTGSKNSNYTDLDPSSMSADNVYSSV